MSNTEDMNELGACRLSAEFCGHPGPRYVVRQYGEWVGSFATRPEASAAVTARGGQLVGPGWTDDNLIADLMAYVSGTD